MVFFKTRVLVVYALFCMDIIDQYKVKKTGLWLPVLGEGMGGGALSLFCGYKV